MGLLNLIFVRLCGWLVLPGRSTASENAELIVVRHEAAVQRRASPRPRPAGPAAPSSPCSSGCCPARHSDATWRQFPRARAPAMPATGFSRAGCAVTLPRLYCLLVIKTGSRHAHIPGTTANPDGPRAVQQTRDLLTDPGDRAAGLRFLT